MPKTTLELLPSWADCDARIKQMGPQGTSALMLFINRYQRVVSEEDEFRSKLAALIDEIGGIAVERHYIGSNKK